MKIDPGDLERAAQIAERNWCDWQDDYEWTYNALPPPVIRCADRFHRFITEYGLRRTIPRARREEIRAWLCEAALRQCLQHQDGRGIDELANQLKEKFKLRGRPTSFVSKISCFIDPEKFVPWDQYARRGAANLLCRSDNFRSYQDYLATVNEIARGPIGKSICTFLKDRPLPTSRKQAFARRVLDVYLMAVGQRWGDEWTPNIAPCQ
jgi:hypothetical protein